MEKAVRYIICPVEGCENILWACQQGKYFIKCESDCWPYPGNERNFNCPKDADVIEQICPTCKERKKL